MAISQSDLRGASNRSAAVIAKRASQLTAFLCHSHVDRDLAKGLQTLLREHGLDLYIDWQDSTMPSTPNAETAAKLRQRIVGCDYFLFLATSNSMSSRWCPWELGYADGKKANDKIAIVPTSDGYTTHGSEYLGLYRHIDKGTNGVYGIFSPGATQGRSVGSL